MTNQGIFFQDRSAVDVTIFDYLCVSVSGLLYYFGKLLDRLCMGGKRSYVIVIFTVWSSDVPLNSFT